MPPGEVTAEEGVSYLLHAAFPDKPETSTSLLLLKPGGNEIRF